MCTLIREILSVDFDSHCNNCPYHEEKFQYQDKIGNVDINDVLTNPYIANDIETLKKYYTVLLSYYNQLNRKCASYQNQIIMLKKGIGYDKVCDAAYSEQGLFKKI